jgi:single-stranded-DNA-specific exonuclease
MVSKWNFTPLTDEQERQKMALSEELGISPILCQLLVQRGIRTFSEAKSFFRPQLTELYDPFLMNDMDKAVERLNQAIGRKEKILVYGDYDVDGITAVALVYKFLRKYFCSKSQVDFYIPDRYTEGYGVSYQGIDYAAKNKFNLVIALDCGIKAVEKVEYANKLGVDFIICDHHTPDDFLPNAVAVLDPKRVDSTYPDSNLSGCGVGFKLMQAFAQNNNIEFESLIPLLDLLAVSIASDIVPINGENRILAFYGLKQLNTSPCVGMKSIIDICGLSDKEISISDVVFKIGPRLNASGRLQSAKEAVKLLIIPEESTEDKDKKTPEKMALKIDQYNKDRKELDKNITDEATEELENAEDFEKQSSIVVYNPSWHKGVVGIVASRLTERYYKPTIVLTHSNGCATGSGRSVQGFDIYKAIESCRDILENFGGHMYAVGLSMKEENVPEFQRRFEKYVSENLSEEQRLPQIDIDACIDFREITPKFFRLLKQFSPYGPENSKPIFVTRRTFDYGTSKVVGKDQEHLKLELIDSKSECIMNGIAFGMSEFNDYIKGLNPVDICYTIEENTFNGNTSIQLVIKDIKKSDS